MGSWEVRVLARRKKIRWGRRIQFWLTLHIGLPVIYALFSLLHKSWRITCVCVERKYHKPGLYAIWHCDILSGVTEIRSAAPGVDVLASRSRDAELGVRFAAYWGATTVRGGSSGGQLDALRGMMRSLEARHAVVIPVDGPRGPARVVKAGCVLVAAHAQMPIIPIVMNCDRAWRFKSWDGTVLPKPFARVTFIFGDPIPPPRSGDREGLERVRLELESKLEQLHEPAV